MEQKHRYIAIVVIVIMLTLSVVINVLYVKKVQKDTTLSMVKYVTTVMEGIKAPNPSEASTLNVGPGETETIYPPFCGNENGSCGGNCFSGEFCGNDILNPTCRCMTGSGSGVSATQGTGDFSGLSEIRKEFMSSAVVNAPCKDLLDSANPVLIDWAMSSGACAGNDNASAPGLIAGMDGGVGNIGYTGESCSATCCRSGYTSSSLGEGGVGCKCSNAGACGGSVGTGITPEVTLGDIGYTDESCGAVCCRTGYTSSSLGEGGVGCKCSNPGACGGVGGGIDMPIDYNNNPTITQ